MKDISTQLTMLIVSLLGIMLTGQLSAAEFDIEGRYDRIKPARVLEKTDKVEVVDVFWYGCGHCYDFMPLLQQWEARRPEFVDFKRLPAIFSDSWAVHARAYYTAEVLGLGDDLHEPLFKAIHEHGRSLNTKEEIMGFFSEHGGSNEIFSKAYDSFTVDAMARQSQNMPRRWGVRGTPSVIVNGRYIISGRGAGSHENMINVLDVLVEREHKAMLERQQGN